MAYGNVTSPIAQLINKGVFEHIEKRPLLRLDRYLKQSYLKNAPMNGRLRNTEKSIKVLHVDVR